MTLEHNVSTLNEPRPTSIDAYFDGPRRVAVEVKFAEREFGTCSRPRLKETDPNYARDHCNGSYVRQYTRTERCALTEQKIRYWDYLPTLFDWPSQQDQTPCKLAASYQLIRNVLSACVTDAGDLDLERGHALIIYDARNPAFALGGKADIQWHATVASLRFPHLLKRLSWQRLAVHLSIYPNLQWLINGLRSKYDITSAT